MSKISMIPGQLATPAVVIHKLAEQAEEMDKIVVMVHYHDGSVSLDLSPMEISDLCALHRYLGVEIDRIMRGEV